MPSRIPQPSREDLEALFRAQARPLTFEQVCRLVNRMGFHGDPEGGEMPWEMECRTKPLHRRLIAMAREGTLWRAAGDVWELAPKTQGDLQEMIG